MGTEGVNIPEPLGVNAAAVAALGDMPNFAGCALAGLGVSVGVKAGESTLRALFALQWINTPSSVLA